MLFKTVVVLLYLAHFIAGYRLLMVYPSPAVSHQRGQQVITQKLAEIGHEVVLISPFPPLREHPNIEFIDVGVLKGIVDDFKNIAVKNYSVFEMLGGWTKMSCDTIEKLMESEGVQKLLNDKSQYFDAVLVEFVGYISLHAFAPYFNSTLIGILSLEAGSVMYQERGNPTHPVLHPGVMSGLPLEPNFLERFQLFYMSLIGYFFQHWNFNPQFDKLTKKFFNFDYTSSELIHMVDFHIEEVSPILHNVRPLLPNTVQIGFIHIEPPKALPHDLQQFMDASKNGVIYLSFGSTVTGADIGPGLIRLLQDTLGSLKYDVIWKFETEIMENKPANVKLMKWLPQPDLLAHKNLRLFITQGGSQSMEEFISRGVPVVAIPFFADQEYNAMRIQQLGVGKCIFKRDLSRDRLTNAIHEVIGNSSYKKKAQELYKRGIDTPMPPVDTAVWWIEYAIRNRGSAHLKYAGAKMPWYQWLLLDIIFAHLIVILFVLWVSYKVITYLVRLTQWNKKKQD